MFVQLISEHVGTVKPSIMANLPAEILWPLLRGIGSYTLKPCLAFHLIVSLNATPALIFKCIVL